LIKLLADENIPKKAVEALRLKGIDIASAVDLSQGLSDREVIELANNENRVIITFDKDFGQLIYRKRMKVTGLILLRFAPTSPEYIAERIEHVLAQGISLENKLVVVREDRIRLTSLK